MDVNITKEKKVTNIRQSNAEELERLVPPRLLSLEQALEFCADDECVEVTPTAVRLRKVILTARSAAACAAVSRASRRNSRLEDQLQHLLSQRTRLTLPS